MISKRRDPLARSLQIFGVLLASVLVACSPIQVRSKPGTTTTVILTRHADRDKDSDLLNEKGHKRALALVEAVRGMGVTAIYSPNERRNLDTARPLAKALGIEITVTPEMAVFVADEIAKEMLDKHAGGVILWVGNVSGNMHAIYHHLGGVGDPPLEYGELFVLTISDNAPTRLEKRHYGP
jgi:nitrogen regulatory protein PII